MLSKDASFLFTLQLIWLQITKYSIKEFFLEQPSTSAVSNKAYDIGC